MAQKYTDKDFKRVSKKMDTLKNAIEDLSDEIIMRTDGTRSILINELKAVYRDIESYIDKEK